MAALIPASSHESKHEPQQLRELSSTTCVDDKCIAQSHSDFKPNSTDECFSNVAATGCGATKSGPTKPAPFAKSIAIFWSQPASGGAGHCPSCYHAPQLRRLALIGVHTKIRERRRDFQAFRHGHDLDFSQFSRRYARISFNIIKLGRQIMAVQTPPQ